MEILVDYSIASGKKIASGKVREIFEADSEHLLIVTTDRISAFDVILPDPIPGKGHVLNQLSLFWFEKASALIANHIVSSNVDDYPAPFTGDVRLKGRSILVKKAKPLPIECIVRGYLSGLGWKEYLRHGSISGIELPGGLIESQRLSEPIFTPTTKANLGEHDESIDLNTAGELVGKDLVEKIRNISIDIYTMAAEHALEKGIIIADTKFEFGIIDDELIIIDEAITPDSSRFWPKDVYHPGGPQPSFDKQFVRDYLETLDWNKTAPGPKLPVDIIQKTSEKYRMAYEQLTGKELLPE